MNEENNVQAETVTNEVENVNNSITENNETTKEVQTVEENVNYSIEDFNTISTVQGEVKLNETILMELKTTNLYLNMILIAIVLCFLYYTISKALKKLFYINI